MFIERLGKTGIEHPYGFWFERRGDVGDSAMFLCCTSPTGTSLWSDRHGYDVSIGSEVPSGLLPLQSCHRAPGLQTRTRIRPRARREKRGCQTAVICPRGYIQISTNKSWYMQRNDPCVYLSYCFSANNLVHKPDA